MNLKMNSRILDLAKQSGSTHKLNLGVYQFYESELKQFAELIVRECAGVTLDYKNDDHYAGWCEHSAEILTRFGIEQ